MSQHWGDLRDAETDQPTAMAWRLETGALQLETPNDAAFNALLRQLVPPAMLGVQRSPWAWIVHSDYAQEAIKLAQEFFDVVMDLTTKADNANPAGSDEDDSWAQRAGRRD